MLPCLEKNGPCRPRSKGHLNKQMNCSIGSSQQDIESVNKAVSNKYSAKSSSQKKTQRMKICCFSEKRPRCRIFPCTIKMKTSYKTWATFKTLMTLHLHWLVHRDPFFWGGLIKIPIKLGVPQSPKKKQQIARILVTAPFGSLDRLYSVELSIGFDGFSQWPILASVPLGCLV